MNGSNHDLDRLLRSAAKVAEGLPSQAPFGFETRVVALWRSGRGEPNDVISVTRFIRRIGAIALAVLALTSAGAYRQFSDNEQLSAPQTNEYAIADTAIQTEFSQ
jgi:hypothetical protein